MTTDAHPITGVLAAFDIPMPIRAPNPNARMHWAEKAQAVKLIRELARYHALNQAPRATERRAVSLMYWLGVGDRTLDMDNLIGGLGKYVIDGLRDAGVIVDDSPRWATFTYHQDRAKDGRRRVAVTVYSVAE